MRSIIHQSVILPASGERLYQMYVSPEGHSAFTGMPVTVDAKAGSPFSAFDGALFGTVLKTIKPSLVIQSWRSVSFKDTDPDSTLILQFRDHDDGGLIELIHLDVPEHDFEGVTKGWEKYYWNPWREYLQK